MAPREVVVPAWRGADGSEARLEVSCTALGVRRFADVTVRHPRADRYWRVAADEDGHGDGARFPNSSQVTAGHGGTFPHSLKQTMFLAVLSIYYSLNVKSPPEVKGPDKIKVLESFCQQFHASQGSKWISNYFQGESWLPRIIFV